MFRNAEGGLKKVLEAMRFFNDEEINLFLKKYDSIPPSDQQRLPWEAIAIAAGSNPRHLVGSILVALQSHAVNMVKIIAMTGHVEVTKKTVEFAKLPSGERDRSMLHQALGFLPSAKGPTFIGKAVFGSHRVHDDDDDDDEGSGGSPAIEVVPVFGKDDDLEELFPSSEKIQHQLVPLRQKMLSGGK